MNKYIDESTVKRRCAEITAKYPGINQGTATLIARQELGNGQELDSRTYNRIIEIENRFVKIDLECIRPARASILGFATEMDKEKIKALQKESTALRAEFRKLTGAPL